jgi:serine/threonine-protein kinase
MIVLLIAAIVAVLVWSTRKAPPPPPPPPALTLTVLDDGVMIGYANVPITIDVFDEPICPPCSKFVTSSTVDVDRAVEDKKLAVRYHLMNFLDQNSASGDYSTRAVAASYCVAQTNDAKMYINFYTELFGPAFQPKENGTTDRTDAELAKLARSVGAPTSVSDCITKGQQVGTAESKASNAQATLEGLSSGGGTPQVFKGTKSIDISTPGWVNKLG